MKKLLPILIAALLLLSGCGVNYTSPYFYNPTKLHRSEIKLPIKSPDELSDESSPAPDKKEKKTLDELVDELYVSNKSIAHAAEEIDAQRLEQTVRMLSDTIGSRVSGSDGNYEARLYIYSQLEELGFVGGKSLYTQGFYSKFESKPPIEQRFEYTENSGSAPAYQFTKNVIARLPSGKPKAPIIIISCHFDSVSTNGAIDNATGVATVLELARIFTQEHYDFDCELRFCFFSGEEQGFHGAAAYLAQLEDVELPRVKAVFNVDMSGASTSSVPKVFTVGTLGRYNEHDAYINGSFSRPADNTLSIVARSIIERQHINAETIVPFHTAKARNDIMPFHKYKIEAVTFSWREVDQEEQVVAPRYMHTADDIADNIDFSTLASMTKTVASSVVAYDCLPNTNGTRNIDIVP